MSALNTMKIQNQAGCLNINTMLFESDIAERCVTLVATLHTPHFPTQKTKVCDSWNARWHEGQIQKLHFSCDTIFKVYTNTVGE